MAKLSIVSSEFSDDEIIPQKFTCEGENVSPELEINCDVEGVMSFAIIVDDPDIPEEVKEDMGIEVFDHWVAYNLPPSTEVISEGEPAGTQGENSAGELGYTGPCPPAEYEPTTHRYFFHVYALDTTLDLDEGATKAELQEAMDGHVIEEARLIGNYESQDA